MRFVWLWAFSLLSVAGWSAPQVMLQDMGLSMLNQQWGSPQRNRSAEGNPLRVAGVEYPLGLGTHAESTFTIRLDGMADRFSAECGVDDETCANGSVRFEVYGDGRLLAQTPVVHRGQPAVSLSANLKGIRVAEFVVSDGGNGIDCDHANWLNPVITMLEVREGLPVAINTIEQAPVHIARRYAGPAPRIMGAAVWGATPGRPVLYRIPVVGERPFTWRVTGLPEGLAFDPTLGALTGRVMQAGRWTIQITARNRHGAHTRSLTLVVEPGALCQTPPMGWNSWNVWAGAISADKVIAAADAMVRTGLADYGYRYVNVDDCWQASRGAEGELDGNERFGSMKALGDAIHARGLLYGVYSSPGPRTCAGYEGSWQYERADAERWASWGVDYIKYDWCSYGEVATGEGQQRLELPYQRLSYALARQPRDIVHSLCQYGMGDVWKWGRSVGGNLWRTTGDITDSWGSLSSIGFKQPDIAEWGQPGSWNDPDMLIVGKVGWGPSVRPTRLTRAEQVTHITMWAMLAAPLLIGCDMDQLDDWTLDLLCNQTVLAVNQDALGRPCRRVSGDRNQEVWVRQLADGSIAVALYNKDRNPRRVTVRASQLGLTGSYHVFDAWRQRNLGVRSAMYGERVPAHGAVLWILTPEAR